VGEIPLPTASTDRAAETPTRGMPGSMMPGADVRTFEPGDGRAFESGGTLGSERSFDNGSKRWAALNPRDGLNEKTWRTTRILAQTIRLLLTPRIPAPLTALTQNAVVDIQVEIQHDLR
jgi:hypothetical protein